MIIVIIFIFLYLVANKVLMERIKNYFSKLFLEKYKLKKKSKWYKNQIIDYLYDI